MSRRTIIQHVAVGAVVAAGLVSVAAGTATAATATVTVPGATVTRSDATTGTTLTVKATVARLDLWCTSGKLVVDKKATAIPCNRLLSVTTTGLVGNDTVAINATGFGTSLPKTALVVKTGAGNDTISVRHRSTLTVYGGDGNDTIEAGFGAGTRPVTETLLGEDGSDRITPLGELVPTTSTDPHLPTDPPADVTTIDGGTGADRFLSKNYSSATYLYADLDDTIGVSANFLHLRTGDLNDLVTIHNDWLNGTTISTIGLSPGPGAVRHLETIPLSITVQELFLETQGGDDTISLDGITPNFPMTFSGGTGNDSIAFRLSDPCVNDPAHRVVTCSDRPLTYGTDIEKATYVPGA